MKKLLNPNDSVLCCGGLGLAAWVFRAVLYKTGLDATGRLVSWHPLTILTWLLTLAALALAAAASRKPKTETGCKYAALPGWGAFALGIALTVMNHEPQMPGNLGFSWLLLGFASVPCLLAACLLPLLGKPAPFLTNLMPALFLTSHLINHYQLWCSNPQFQDIFFPLFASISLIVAGYHRGALDIQMGSRKTLTAACCTAAFLCLAELAVTAYPWLYLGGALWAVSCLWWKEV